MEEIEKNVESGKINGNVLERIRFGIFGTFWDFSELNR